MIKFPRRIKVQYLGRLAYKESLEVQSHIDNEMKFNAINKIKTDYHGTLLLMEHNPVYTVGVRSQSYDDEVEKKLKGLNADFFRTNRGGLITFHGPGQLVAYPILNLKYFEIPLRCYVSSLESMIINLCKFYGVNAHTSPDTGVWVGDKKICAIGIRASRFVVTHGIGFNCNTDLSWFSHIVPCGIEGKGVTSLSDQLNRNVTIKEVIPEFLKCFQETFKTEFTEVNHNCWE